VKSFRNCLKTNRFLFSLPLTSVNGLVSHHNAALAEISDLVLAKANDLFAIIRWLKPTAMNFIPFLNSFLIIQICH